MIVFLIISVVIFCAIHSEGADGAIASVSSTFHFADVCTASQVVELVFNSSSGKYEYWDVQVMEGEQQAGSLNLTPVAVGDGTIRSFRNDERDNNNSTSPSSSFFGGEYDGEANIADSRNTPSSSPPDRSDHHFNPKISAGRFRKCTCKRQYYMMPSSSSYTAETNFTPLDESARIYNNVTTGHDEMLDVVCPLTADVCAIPLDDDDGDDDDEAAATNNNIVIQCFIPNKASVKVIRNIWPLLMVWYSCFVSFLVCSYRGRHALLCCLRNTCCPRLNDRLVYHYLRRQDRQREQYRRRLRRSRRQRNGLLLLDDSTTLDDNNNAYHFSWLTFWGRRQNRQDDDGIHIMDHNFVTPPPGLSNRIIRKELILPTKSYHRRQCSFIDADLETGVREDDGECGKTLGTLEDGAGITATDHTSAADCCVICFVDLDEGDRIGDLPCRHLYHVHCLKKWISRRNACPLCSSPMAAEAELAMAHKNLELLGTLER